jgi:hypothetical protein
MPRRDHGFGHAGHLIATAVVVLAAGCAARPTPTSRPAADAGSSNVASGSHPGYRHRWTTEEAAVDSTPLRLLGAWDAARAAAYAEGSVPALRRLYTPGSSAGDADVEMLREYGARGFRVVGMEMQILRVEVLDHRPGEWLLEVTDRLHDAVAVSEAERIRLPRDRASTRELRLVRRHGRWLVDEVRATGGGG